MTAIDSALVNREFGQAKRAWLRVLAVQGLLMLVPLASLAAHPVVTGASAVLCFLGVVLLFLLKGTADSAYERAEEARRAVLLDNALGVAPDPSDGMRLLSDAARRPSGDPAPVGDYYNSNHAKGPSRLVHLLWESAHCTEKVSQTVATHALLVSVVGASTVVVSLVVALLSHAAAARAEGVANAAMMLMGLFGAGLFAELHRTFSGLASVAGETALKCEGLLRQSTIELSDAVKVLERYDVAVGRAAPIPSYVWRKKQAELAESWELTCRRHTGAYLPAGECK